MNLLNTLSIIVPVGEKYLINSKISTWQKYFEKNLYSIEIEMLIIYNGDREYHEKQGEAYLCGSIEIREFFISEGNPGSARNFGLDNAKGNWIIFWDCDDLPVLDPIIEFIQSQSVLNYDAVMFSYQVVDSQTNTICESRFATTKSLERNLCNPGLWRILLRKETISNKRFPPLKVGEDQIFLLNLEIEKIRLKYSDKISYSYFVRNVNQLTSQQDTGRNLGFTLDYVLSNFYKIEANNRIKILVILNLLVTFVKRSSAKEATLGIIGFVRNYPDVMFRLFKHLNLIFLIMDEKLK